MTGHHPGTAVSVGIDDGFAATKIALPDGRLVVIPSRGRIGPAAVSHLIGGSSEVTVADYMTDDTLYCAGDVDGASTRFDGYPSSGLNRILVQHALQVAGLGGQTLHAMSGLPMSGFYHSDGSRRTTAIEAKRASLLKPVTCVDGRRPAEIAFHGVIPEALAAWYDYVIEDGAGEVHLESLRVERPVAVVDIGGRTTDFAVVSGQALQHTASGSVPRGLLDVKAALSEVIAQRFDLETVDERLADQALQSGRVRLLGRDHDVSDVLDTAKRALLEELYDETRGKLGRAVTLDAVHFVGGGAVVLADQIKNWFPHSSIAPHPTFANARGMLKFLRYVGEASA